MTGAEPVGTQRTAPVVLGHFLNAEDSRRALNGLQKHCRDLTVRPLAEPVDGRSWCLSGCLRDTSERLTITTVIERWGGEVFPVNGFVADRP